VVLIVAHEKVKKYVPEGGNMLHEIKLERVYSSSQAGGMRILVDRLWPRGIQKERAAIDLWLKEVGPTSELRKWFHHDAALYEEFRNRYIQELQEDGLQRDAFLTLLAKAKEQDVTLLYGAKDEEHNQAIVLKEMLVSELEK
jgi:uncharacterized protein YeaO (DUF488 family)